MKRLKIIFTIIVYIFAVIGFLFTFVYFAMQFGLLNVRGSIKERNDFYKIDSVELKHRLDSIRTNNTKSKLKPVVTNNPKDGYMADTINVCKWTETSEWQTVKGGLIKDKDIILRVAKETNISPRLLIAVVIPEQARFFTAQRESFKKYFEPLKILGSLSRFSLGISGIKQETAKKIEEHLIDVKSPFYPGPKYNMLINYKDSVDKDEELYKRLTNSHNHYYSFLYTALFIKQIEAQWKSSGYDINTAPGATITLFNIGFHKSKPKEIAELGGTTIKVGGKTYYYGQLGLLFFNSKELSDIFPS